MKFITIADPKGERAAILRARISTIEHEYIATDAALFAAQNDVGVDQISVDQLTANKVSLNKLSNQFRKELTDMGATDPILYDEAVQGKIGK